MSWTKHHYYAQWDETFSSLKKAELKALLLEEQYQILTEVIILPTHVSEDEPFLPQFVIITQNDVSVQQEHKREKEEEEEQQ